MVAGYGVGKSDETDTAWFGKLVNLNTLIASLMSWRMEKFRERNEFAIAATIPRVAVPTIYS